jgi:sugar porter (SP) family MFS transporter
MHSLCTSRVTATTKNIVRSTVKKQRLRGRTRHIISTNNNTSFLGTTKTITTQPLTRRKETTFNTIIARSSLNTNTINNDDDNNGKSVSDSMDEKDVFNNVLPAVVVACVGSFLFGFHLGIVNPALDAIANSLGIAGHAQLKSAIVSIILAFAAIGSLLASPLADKLGRRSSLTFCAAPLLVGAGMCAQAMTVSEMLIGRAISGIGVGMASGLVPLYINEISPENFRGTLGSLVQLSICVGILAAVLLGIPYDPNFPALQESISFLTFSFDKWWRSMFYAAGIPALFLGFAAKVIPESPKWLRSQGRIQEAIKAEKLLWGGSYQQKQQQMQLENVQELQQEDEEKLMKKMTENGSSSSSSASWIEALFDPRYRKGVWIGAILFFAQQFAGINAVIYFSTPLFASAGLRYAVMGSVAVCVVNIFGTLLSTKILDKTGRKPLLKKSFLGMGVCCVFLSLAALNPSSSISSYVSLYGTLLYIFAFGMGVGPIPGLLAGELNSERVRAKAMSFAFLSHWVFNFCIGQGFLPIVQKIGIAAVWALFASVSFISSFMAQKFLVETRGKSFAEIDKEMNR